MEADFRIHIERNASKAPGHTYGGASAAILDEVMGLVVWAAGHQVVAANINININYRKPLPLHQPLLAEARITEVGEKKNYQHRRNQSADLTVAVSGSGVYVVAPHLFEASRLKGVAS